MLVEAMTMNYYKYYCKEKTGDMFYEAVRITETDLPVLTCAGVKFADTGLCNICIGARPGRLLLLKILMTYFHLELVKNQ